MTSIQIRKLARRAGIVVAALAAVWLLAGYVLAPYLLERAVARYGGADASPGLAVARIDFEPFTLTARLEQIELTAADAVLRAERARADFSAASLWRRRAVLDVLALDNVRLAVTGIETNAPWHARLAELVTTRTAPLPELVVGELDVAHAVVSLSGPEADGGTELFAATGTVNASGVTHDSRGLAFERLELGAAEADGVSIELTGRLARNPTVISGRFHVGGLELARAARELGGALAARTPNGVLEARGGYALGGERFGRLELGGTALDVADPSLRLADGGAVSARRLEAELDVELDLATRGARATGRATLARPMLSDAAGASARLGAERITADGVSVQLPPVAIEAASARVTGWRTSLDVAAGGAPRLPDWPLAVETVELAGGALTLVDSHRTPAVEIDVDAASGRLTGFAAGRPPRVVELEGRLAGTDDGTLGVRLARSGARRYDRADVTVAGLPAERVSPYAERHAGKQLTAGRVDLTLSYRHDGRTSGFADWAASGLELAAPAPDGSAEPAPADEIAVRSRFSDAAPGPALPLELAAALATGSDGRLEISAPLDPRAGAPAGADADGADVLPYLPGIAGAALARRVEAIASAPYDTLAGLVDADAAELGAVPFEPGSAELVEAADARLARLAAALAERPRLSVGAGGAYAPADRDVLAAEQVRVHVALATAEAARGDPSAPLDFASPRVQDVLDEFAGQRLAADARDALAARFPAPADAEPAERVPYYEAVFAALADEEPVPEQMRNRLARYRGQAIASALERHGVTAERIVDTTAGAASAIGTDGRVLVPLVLGAL